MFSVRGFMRADLLVSMSCRVCSLVFCLLLAACASQPDGSHSFTVAPANGDPGIWKLDGLAASGRIDLTLRLNGEAAEAAIASIEFNYRDKYHPDVGLDFDDRACRGAYTVALSHRRTRAEGRTDYLAKRLPWEKTARLRLEWRSDGRFAVTVNEREQRIVESISQIRNLAVEVRYGEMVVDDLTYTQLAANAPFLPAEHVE
jgi:hypothetical protein